MSLTDPQAVYMVFVLPSLFGLTLLGEGLDKIIKDEAQGWISLITGVLFIILVVFLFFFLKQA